MHDVLSRLGDHRLVPVVKIERAADALALGHALIAGGLPVAEITFRTDAAEAAIRHLSEGLPELLVGAGTVLTVDHVRRAVAAGARFIVAPGFNPRIVDYCLERGIPVVPGVNAPTEIELGLERGLQLLKFFPAEASGGIRLLKAMAAPYAGVAFMPTGGITAANLRDYLALDVVVACGGTWMVETKLISDGRFDEIARLTRAAVNLIAGGI